MQGVFAPASPRGGGESAPLAAPLGAPLVNWGEVTAVPDTVHGTGHEELATYLVYSPLPNFKLGQYHFFIVPKGTAQTKTISKATGMHWLVAYTDKEACGNTWGVPFSIVHQEKIEKLRSAENMRIKQNYEKQQKIHEMAVAKEKTISQLFDKTFKKLIAQGGDPSIDEAKFTAALYGAQLNLPTTASKRDVAETVHNNLFGAIPAINPDFVVQVIEKMESRTQALEEVTKSEKDLQAAKIEFDTLKDAQQIKSKYVWKNGRPGAELNPYSVEVLTAGRLCNYILQHVHTNAAEDDLDVEDLAAGAANIAKETLGDAVASAVAALVAGTYISRYNLSIGALFITIQTDFADEASKAAEKTYGVANYAYKQQIYNYIMSIPSSAGQLPRAYMLDLYKALAKSFWPESGNGGPMDAIYHAIWNHIMDPQKYNDRNTDDEPAIPHRDYLPAGMANVYEIDEEWLRERVENAEVFDYDFAVRMQGLSNSTLAAVWAPPASNPVLDNGHVIMQRFAETLIDHFYDMFVVQEKKDYSPESVIREVVHMHKAFADEWVRQNKNTLSPQLEAMGEAYVSLFSTGPLSGLRDYDAALIARLLRRHEKYRGHFGLCLQHYMAKMEGDRIGRSPTYKQTNILANQNMLAVKSMAGFLQSNLAQIQKDLQTEEMPTIPSDITKLFNKFTVDWFRIADQLPPPRSRFPGYKHPEGADQDPNRQSKWQKVLDHSSRGGKVG